MNAQPQQNPMNPEIEQELARHLSIAHAENKPAEIMIAGNLYHLVPVEETRMTAADVQAAQGFLGP